MVERMKREAFDAFERQIDRYHHGRMVNDLPTPAALIAGEIGNVKMSEIADG